MLNYSPTGMPEKRAKHVPDLPDMIHFVRSTQARHEQHGTTKHVALSQPCNVLAMRTSVLGMAVKSTWPRFHNTTKQCVHPHPHAHTERPDESTLVGVRCLRCRPSSGVVGAKEDDVALPHVIHRPVRYVPAGLTLTILFQHPRQSARSLAARIFCRTVAPVVPQYQPPLGVIFPEGLFTGAARFLETGLVAQWSHNPARTLHEVLQLLLEAPRLDFKADAVKLPSVDEPARTRWKAVGCAGAGVFAGSGRVATPARL